MNPGPEAIGTRNELALEAAAPDSVSELTSDGEWVEMMLELGWQSKI